MIRRIDTPIKVEEGNLTVQRIPLLVLLLISSQSLVVGAIGNLNPGQLPSKIIEYISTGKPVIHFAEIDDDPVIQISKQFNNLIIVNTDSNLPELEDKLNKIFLNIDTFNKETFIKNYSAGAITSNLDIL